jgi:hypothetical protein
MRTAWVRAFIWSLVGMNPQMVEEVVPFPEMLPTVFVLAL